ncbi:spermidine synthase [Williamsia limnetica]|uniref:Polyamine aminopropyltransferase n=1 Tax=Williamsia limnetica TaxID=882452 RepID=A0A318RFE3_WILLI|nr:polyamine aminopropyltransferase [Williamsia limnetica]PYE12990.1 spermidine synthase [Williamsia limnetica]
MPPLRRAARSALLAVVFICAACGLVYELALVTLGSYLIGNTATQAAIVLSVMVFAMGMGSLAAKPLQNHAAVGFAVIELVLALLGGLSVLLLYGAFAYMSLYTQALVVVAFLLGLLIGAEIPLLMVMLQRIRAQSAGSAVADLFAADYVGALVGGLAFPFLLLPFLGQIRGALVVGMVNAVAGAALVLIVFRRDLGRVQMAAVGAGSVGVVAVLVAAMFYASTFEVNARQALYRDPIVLADRTTIQDIVMTNRSLPGNGSDTRLYLNGDLQFSSVDEYRYHEALVHPALTKARERVLILGGGDGLAMREVLKYPDVRSVHLVELDPRMTELARNDPRLTELNGHALADDRVTVVNEDAFAWLRRNSEMFDAVIVDMPDPDESATAKLYSVEFYGLIRAHLAPDARIVVQAGSPYFAPRSFWCIGETLAEAGITTEAYHVDVPSFGDWGFFLGAAGDTPPAVEIDPAIPLRFLSPEELAAARTFPLDRPRLQMPASTLMQPRILEYSQSEWSAY